ncbi:DUF6624 domain-containing protein [Flagellimonas lutimaris]|uniref:DUF6624 domain-containing protein n=1 Tax=Flagellimonas lutimaris TaxID=475082 RepID=UPI003F5CDFC5
MFKYSTLLLLILTLFISCKENNNSGSSTIVDVDLKSQLENIYLKDQGIREIVDGNLSEERKSELLKALGLHPSDIEGNKRFEVMQNIDSTNLAEVEKIIKDHGYPSLSIVGEPTNKAIFYVIQHSDKIDKYIQVIREAAENGDIPKTSLAMMEDRNLMDKGLEQMYGTQIKGQANKQGEWIYFLWPIKNVDSVNIWRKQVGFDQSLEEYLNGMGVEFKLYQLDELEDL